MVSNSMHGNAGLLGHFAHDRVLETLARLNKPRNRRVTPGRPAGLPAEQCTRAVADHDDDRRINARKCFLGAARIGTAQHVPGTFAQQAGAARAAKAMP